MSGEPNYDFSTAEQLLALCAEYKTTIGEIMLRREIHRSRMPRAAVIAEMQKNLEVMRESVREGLEEKQSSATGFTGGDAERVKRYASRSYMGEAMSDMVASAMAVVEVNSGMGLIVAAPTAGSSGVLPGCLVSAAKTFGYEDETIIMALFTAAAIGMLIAENYTLAGSEGGCHAEVGAASAMAAAALVELHGGLPAAAVQSAAIALKNLMGLVCDPVAGLVECPCIKRNAIGAANAAVSADLALSGVVSIIPFDEVLSASKSVGRQMNPDLKETAKGGIAATPTAKAITRMLRGKPDEDE